MFSGLLESLRVFLRFLLDVESPPNLPEARQLLLSRAEDNLSVAGVENKHVPTIAYLPPLDSLRGGDVLCHGQPLVRDRIVRISFNGKIRTCGYGQGN